MLQYFFLLLTNLDSRISNSLDSIVFGYKIAISINGVNFWSHDVGWDSGIFGESTLSIDYSSSNFSVSKYSFNDS